MTNFKNALNFYAFTGADVSVIAFTLVGVGCNPTGVT